MPNDGSLNNQDPLFYEVFPFFVQRYQEKKYVKVWRDVSDYVSTVLQSIFGKKGR